MLTQSGDMKAVIVEMSHNDKEQSRLATFSLLPVTCLSRVCERGKESTGRVKCFMADGRISETRKNHSNVGLEVKAPQSSSACARPGCKCSYWFLSATFNLQVMTLSCTSLYHWFTYSPSLAILSTFREEAFFSFSTLKRKEMRSEPSPLLGHWAYLQYLYHLYLLVLQCE